MKISIYEWIGQANEIFRSLVFNESEDIYFVKESGGYKAYLRDKPKSPSSITSAAASSYSGPFAVVKKDDTTVTVQGYNFDEGRYFNNEIDIGLGTNIQVAEADISGITTDSVIYVKITYSNGNYTAVLGSHISTLPAGTDTEYYERIAFVHCSAGKIADITQCQGFVKIIGRFV